MGWSIGYDENWQRDIGYGVPAICDHPKCNEPINRGLSYVCGGQPFGGKKGCGLYFCYEHLGRRFGADLCSRCARYKQPFDAKPDVTEWIEYKLTEGFMSGWRARSYRFLIQAMEEEPTSPWDTADDRR